MREIRFRGKRKNNGEWIEGSLLTSVTYPNRAWINDGITFIDRSLNNASFVEVDPSTVGQYTGLTDKNGVKIFEGDIVKWCRKDIVLCGHYTHGFRGYKYGDKLIVRRLESGFVLCGKNDDMPDFPSANEKVDNYAFWNYQGFLEVIGNIHDNPELLEGVV